MVEKRVTSPLLVSPSFIDCWTECHHSTVDLPVLLGKSVSSYGNLPPPWPLIMESW